MEKPKQLPVADFVKEESLKRKREQILNGSVPQKKTKTIYINEEVAEEAQTLTLGSVMSEILAGEGSAKDLLSANAKIVQHEKEEHQKSITHATEKKILHSKSHHKPTVETELLRKQEEERLKKLATAGIVAALNAVRKRQKENEKIAQEKQKQEVAIIQLKSEELKKQKKLERQAEREKKLNSKRPVNVEKEEVSWGVLSDDYLLNPSIGDWNDGNS